MKELFVERKTNYKKENEKGRKMKKAGLTRKKGCLFCVMANEEAVNGGWKQAIGKKTCKKLVWDREGRWYDYISNAMWIM